MARLGLAILLSVSACVAPPPTLPPVCVVPERLVFDVAQPSQRLVVSNPFDEPGVVTIVAPGEPFSVDDARIVRLEPHEVREVVVRYSLARSADVRWRFSPAVGCEPVELTLSGVAADAALSVSPGRLDFGVLPAPARSLTVRNHTHVAVQLRSLAFSSAAFSSATQVPLEVPALGSVELEVEARGAGPLEGTLTIEAEGLRLTVPLLANRAAPCLVASREVIDFGTLEVACRARDELVSVTNTCPHPVRIVGSEVTGGFALISGAGRALEPAQSATLAIGFVPVSEGRSGGKLSVSVDVLDGVEQLEVVLVGDATPMEVVEEVYALRRPERDVVILLEDSPAMLRFADALRRSLSAFAHQLNTSEDIRVAVMTTSTAPSQLARLRRTPTGALWLDNPSDFALEAQLSLSGSSTARSSCLEVLEAAFAEGSELRTMLRPGARLDLNCITSGADQLQSAPAPLIASLVASMPRFPSVTLVGHFSSQPECDAPLDPGSLTTFAWMTNGTTREVCSALWWLGEQSADIGYPVTFQLERRPSFARAPLEVSIDGVPIPEAPYTWSYVVEQNAVRFEPFATPLPGQTLRVKYSPDCR